MENSENSYYHIYLRGNHRQDFFYKMNDYINAINRLALAAYHTSTIIWALEYLTNHFHLVIETANRSAFMHYYRMSLSLWYNHEYGVSGTVGKRCYGWGKITHPSEDGGEDLKDAIGYTLRNCKKHDMKEDFYTYTWSSIRLYFSEPKEVKLISQKEASHFLPQRIEFPQKYRISKSGMILPQDFINVKGVESLFETKERFYSFLSKQTKRELRNAEDQKDAEALRANSNEGTAHVDRTRLKGKRAQVPITDIVISETIINELEQSAKQNRNSPKTIPQMNFDEKITIARFIKSIYPESSISQLSRILQIPKSTLQRHVLGHLAHATDPFPKK